MGERLSSSLTPYTTKVGNLKAVAPGLQPSTTDQVSPTTQWTAIGLALEQNLNLQDLDFKFSMLNYHPAKIPPLVSDYFIVLPTSTHVSVSR